jgi:hypothetical protein
MHLPQRFIDYRFSIVIADAADRIVNLYAAPLHVPVSPIHPQFFSFFGTIVRHDEVPSNGVCTL